ncbi:MAG: sel1 repeat family protein [Maricaulaceae bacterium]
MLRGSIRIIILACIFTLLSFTSGCVEQESSVFDEIDNNKELIKLSNLCPSELIQESDISFNDETNYCERNQQSCLSKCLTGSSNHCFGLANHFNIVESPEKYSRPLYAKSCQLGLASSCTNMAAGMKRDQGLEAAICYTPTFQKTCELDDPWGCTMYAVSLIYGEGVKKDTDVALDVLKNSCRFGETDRACSTAMDLASDIIKGDFSEE